MCKPNRLFRALGGLSRLVFLGGKLSRSIDDFSAGREKTVDACIGTRPCQCKPMRLLLRVWFVRFLFFYELDKQRADLHFERAFAKKKMANQHHTDGSDYHPKGDKKHYCKAHVAIN